MRRWIKRIGIVCLIPVVGVILIFLLLYIPFLQDFAVRSVTRYAGEITGMEIHAERIRLAFPLRLSVRDVQVVTSSDTLLALDRLEVNVRLLPLLKQHIQVETIDLQGVKVNTGELLPGIGLQGTLGRFYARDNHIALSEETARLNKLELSDTALTLWLNDTTDNETPDTASLPVNWKLSIDALDLDRIAFAMQIPYDTLRLSSYIHGAKLTEGTVDLGQERYGAARFTLDRSTFQYDSNDRLPEQGFDPSHIRLDGVDIRIDSLLYGGREMHALLRTLTAADRSGLSIRSLTGSIQSDSTALRVPSLCLQTPYSEIRLLADAGWHALEDNPQGTLRALLTASIGKEDLFLLTDMFPDSLRQSLPKGEIALTAGIEGDAGNLRLSRLKGEWPGIFDLNATGEIRSLTDSIQRNGELQWSLHTGNLGFLLKTLPPAERPRYNLPPMRLTGKAALEKYGNCRADLLLHPEGETGAFRLTAAYRLSDDSYSAAMRIDSIRPTLFLPQDSLYSFTAAVQASGKGFDPFSPSTNGSIKGDVTEMRYGGHTLSDIHLKGTLERQMLKFGLQSSYPLAQMEISLDAMLRKQQIEAMLVADVQNLDLYGMHLTNDSLSTSFRLFAEARTDMEKDNLLDVTLGNCELIHARNKYTPKTLTLHAQSNADTTHVSFHVGDAGITLTGNADIGSLANRFARLSRTMSGQLERDSMINLNILRPLLPEMYLHVTARKDNPVHNILQQRGITFERMDMVARTSPEDGLYLNACLDNLMQDTARIDTVRFNAEEDSIGLIYNIRIAKTPYRKQQPFAANVQGHVRHTFADAELLYANGKRDTDILLGIRVDKVPQGIRLHLFPEEPVLAFRPFRLNPDNYILYRDLNHLAADVRLTGAENASLRIHSETEEERTKAIYAELSQINLKTISEGFPGFPTLQGMLNTNVQYAPSDSNFLIIADAYIDSLFYEGGQVGELFMNSVYLPVGEKEHQIDFHLYRDRREITSVSAFYRDGTADSICGEIKINALPLEMINPFIPNRMAELAGTLQGELTVAGISPLPDVNGYLRLDSSSVYVTAVGSSFRFDNQAIQLDNNRIRFNRYNLYAVGDNPFVIDGTIDLRNPSRMTADLQLNAYNLQLLNAKRNRESMAYGKLTVNLNSTVKGPLQALTMRGDLQLLGGTDVTYVMRESPLTAQDRLANLVTFVDFSDTLQTKLHQHAAPFPVGGLDMLMTIRIDQSVRLNADITPDQSSRIELEGGGDLSFQYTPQNEMILNGRYSLSGGMVKYAMPIIPLKEFIIQDGSYVQWSGDPMNPVLNLTATERMRAAVSQEDGGSRLVTFLVGVAIKQTLDNPQLQFILSAPEDPSMQQELDRMDDGQRSQIAVTMLVSGMYINMDDVGSGGKKPNLNMGTALNSFLQSEINNIAGSALKSVDITLGMEQYDENGTGSGGERTDFSFRFAKRFYNDRISIILGGRVSTGQDVNAGQNQQFIDNVSIEYRLDNSGTRYIKLFHDKNYESLLEGEITETGAGIVLRKKMLRLRELFMFNKKNKTKPVTDK